MARGRNRGAGSSGRARTSAKRDAAVRRQYEELPYPPRDPMDERKRLITGSPSHLLELNHYVFAGRRDFHEPFRALVAGGGTGDAAIMLAQQLAWTGGPGEVVYLDISAASRKIAEKRAEVRGLRNISFVTGSLLDVPELGLGTFDYIDCCGVLHHLEDPDAGLAALVRVLAPEGGLGIMLYGTLGRTGVYPLQNALRALAGGDASTSEKLDIARSLLGGLPETNWFQRNPFLGDHRMDDDAALYDLLLHSRDRSYTVGEVFQFAQTVGLAPTAFIEPVRYDPLTYLQAPKLRRRAAALPFREQAALAENLAGSLKVHICYLVRAECEEASVAAFGPDMTPRLRDGDAMAMARAFAPGKESLRVNYPGGAIRLPVPPDAAQIIGPFDGARTFGTLARSSGVTWNAYRKKAEPVYRVLNGLNLLYLEAGSSQA